MTLTAIEPDPYPWFEYRGHTFCLGLLDGDAAWTSGQSSSVFDPATGRMEIEGDLADQAALSYTKLLAVLEEAGLGPADVVHVTENVTAAGIPDYELAAATRERVFGTRRPTVSTVVVDRLVRSKALIELELHAIPGGGSVLGPDQVRGTLTPSPVRAGHDGTVHLPTILPVDDDGVVLFAGDPVAQYGLCLELATAALEGAGLGTDAIVACHEYMTPDAAVFVTDLAELRAHVLPHPTVGGTVVMERLHLDRVSVAIDVTASTQTAEVVDPGEGWLDGTPIVPALKVGQALYCSAISTDGGGLGSQAEEVYRRLVVLLATAGLGPESLRSTIEFCAKDRIGEYKVVAGVRSRLLSAPWPASTGDLCTGFGRPGTLLQTVAIANYPG